MEEPGLLGTGTLDDMAEFYATRARGGVGLMVTGGMAPNFAGSLYLGASKITTSSEAEKHRIVTEAVHKNDGKIVMQILHAGRYAYHFSPVSASAIKSPIGQFKPRALSRLEVYETIDDFVNTAVLAKSVGYDGVEIMGSEGYLINQFLVERTNQRTDEWGGSYKNRMRFPVEIVKRVREAVGEDFIIIYRLSMLDLVEGGSSWDQVVELGLAIENAGASIVNTGIGWHEARVPTIATSVPRGAFTWVTKRMKSHLSIPLCTTNRINNPGTAEDILASGAADMISMARPFLADPNFMKKAYEGRQDEINTCIGCNQACLDHTFVGRTASCLVNPVAAHENSLKIEPTKKPLKIAVIGAGPAGMACANTAAIRGHTVTLYDKDSDIGGQFNIAKQIPGKEEFYETLRYFRKQLKLNNVTLKLNTIFEDKDASGYDAVVVATGVLPRQISIPNKSTKVQVLSYIDVLRNHKEVGRSVAVIGAGGIGFDVSEYLTHNATSHMTPSKGSETVLGEKIDETLISEFNKEWNIDPDIMKGGLLPPTKASDHKSERKVYLLQRKKGKLGSTLGKTTGWIHKSTLKKRQVEEISGCKYVEINDDGLVININEKETKTLPVDTVVVCAGQESYRSLYDSLVASKKTTGSSMEIFMIGGAYAAGELDAKRAIDQGTRLAANIEKAKTGEVFQVEEEPKVKYMKMMQSFLKKK